MRSRRPDGQHRSVEDRILWGVATSAFQNEGSPRADGKAESIWDDFVRLPGAIADGSNADVACESYRRWPEDVRLLRELGVDAYRFSVAWPRVLPNGRDAAARGLDTYDRLVDALLDAGVEPFVTLYHWDLPRSLQDEGGWTARSTARAFADYAGAVARRLGDRVGHWITVNEPEVVAYNGHVSGTHAPGGRDLRAGLQVAHHLLVAHGLAVEVLRAEVGNASVGISCNIAPVDPSSGSGADVAAARRVDGIANRWFLDALSGRGYPDDVTRFLGDCMPVVEPDDHEVIARPCDFLGVNYYTRHVVTDAAGHGPADARFQRPSEVAATASGWEVHPEGLSDVLTRVSTEYEWPAYYVTENGAAFDDSWPDGDIQRISYLRQHAERVLACRAAGVPVRGYFVWTLLDNFEWERGYTTPFGIARRDRTLKASGRWFARFVAAQRSGDVRGV